MPEVMNGVYLNLVVLYKWVDSDKCNIQIGWEPADKNHAKLASPSDDLSYNFHNGTIKLLINGQEIPPTEKTTEELDPGKLERKTLYSCRMLNADNTSVLTSGYIRGYGDTLSGLSNIKTINIEFLYYFDSIYIPLNISDQDDFNSKILALNESLGDNYNLFKLNRVNNPTLAMGNPIPKTSTYEDGGEYYYSAAPLAENITSENFNDQKELLCYWDSNTSKYIIAKDEEYDSNKIYHYRTRVISKIDITGNKAVRIQKPSKYEHNVVFNEAGLNELISNIKKYPVIDIQEVAATQWTTVSDGQPSIKILHGNPNYNGSNNYKYVKVGSNVKFLKLSATDLDNLGNSSYITKITKSNDEWPTQKTGTFRVSVNNDIFEVPINGLSGDSSGSISLGGDLIPSTNATYQIGTSSKSWKKLYLDPGTVNAGEFEPIISASYTDQYDENTVGKVYPSFAVIAAVGTGVAASSNTNNCCYAYGSYGGTTFITAGESTRNTVKEQQLYNLSGENEDIYLLADNNIRIVPYNGAGKDNNNGYENSEIFPEVKISGYKENNIYKAKLELSNGYIQITEGDLYLSNGNAYVSGNLNIRNSNGVSTSNAKVLNIEPYGTIKSYQESENNHTHNHIDIIAKKGTNNATLKIVCGEAFGTNPSGFNTGLNRMHFNGYINADRVYSAVFNDYAEYRTTINLEPGRVVIDNDDGSLSCSSNRLQPGAQVISDTFGHSMGETDTAKTPLAVAGRVLVYTYQPRENYHAGMAVCSAPDGTVDIMTREEIRDYPDCIVGIVSEIPQYETWGSDNVKVDRRIWIKVK